MEEFRARPKLEADKLTMDLLRWHGGNFVDCKLLSSEARPALRPAEPNRTHPARAGFPTPRSAPYRNRMAGRQSALSVANQRVATAA
jgi:hypothetical protein